MAFGFSSDLISDVQQQNATTSQILKPKQMKREKKKRFNHKAVDGTETTA